MIPVGIYIREKKGIINIVVSFDCVQITRKVIYGKTLQQ